MPTAFSHPAVPLAMGIGLGYRLISKQLFFTACFASVLPDLDVIAFRFGIPYASGLGHRGFSHSLLFALLVALVGASCHKALRSTFTTAFLCLFIATVSHGILDAFTNGGLGVAFLWPFSIERFFAPYKLIEVSPLRMSRFLSPRGVTVLVSELVWVWGPFIFAGIIAALMRKRFLFSKREEGSL